MWDDGKHRIFCLSQYTPYINFVRASTNDAGYDHSLCNYTNATVSMYFEVCLLLRNSLMFHGRGPVNVIFSFDKAGSYENERPLDEVEADLFDARFERRHQLRFASLGSPSLRR